MHPHSAQQGSLSTVDSVINSFFERSIKDAATIDPTYERLWKALYSLIQSGGKRLRPKMTLLSYEAFGGSSPKQIMPIAAAQELLHFSLLIHDDVIDRDYIRYGVANIAGQYRQTYCSRASSAEDLIHFANSAAIIAGDLMLSGAHQLIASSELPRKSIATAQRLLSNGIFEVAAGQLLDFELSFMPYKQGDALKVAIYKTASYSFVPPLLTGASLAGAESDQLSDLRDFAIALGVAFQFTDDILGVFGDEKKTGKSNISDITEGKRTFMVEKAFKLFSTADRAVFMKAFGNADASHSEIEAAKLLLESSGARYATEQRITHYTDLSRQSLAKLNLEQDKSQLLEQIISWVTNRSS